MATRRRIKTLDLLSRNVVTADQLKRAEPTVSSQDRLGKSLVRMGLLTPNSLWQNVRGQLTEIIYSLFHWDKGTFDFREGDPPAEKIALDTSVMSLIIFLAAGASVWAAVPVSPVGRKYAGN